MITLALRLIGWGKIALRAAVGAFARWPRECAIALLLVACAWLWRAERRTSEAFAAYRYAAEQAGKAQAALRATERKQYEERAHEADQKHKAALADARDATSRYVAAHRVVVPSGGQCATVAVSEADPAGVRPDVPGGAVVVAEADVQRAAEWQVYALALREWALSVTK